MTAPAVPPKLPAPVDPAARRRRPAVLDAARAALIPLRPLTIGEVLDAGFTVLRANARMMMGLPLAVAGLGAVYVLVVTGVSYLLGEATGPVGAVLPAVFGALLGILMLAVCVAWMSAVLTRAALHTLLGDGFAPASRISWRQATAMFWPMVGLSLLSAVVTAVVNTVASYVYYLLLILLLASGTDSDAGFVIVSLVATLVGLLVYGAGYSYISLAVPAWTVENTSMPGWIGKPARPTNIVTAFGRSILLVGWRDLPRAAAVMAAVFGIGLLVAGVVYLGLGLVALLYADVVGLDPLSQLAGDNAVWVVLGSYAVVAVLVFSGLSAFLASVQTVLYLDLRMRREGLDLALRFDEVEVPQPSAPPVPRLVPLRPAPPPPPPPAAPPGYAVRRPG